MRLFAGLAAALLFAAATWAVPVSAADAAPQRRFITADSSKNRIAIINAAGETEWEYKIGPLHDLQVLPNGNVLFQTSWTRLVEVNPKNNEV
ncbi:MAG TPA: hypothetical protein VGE52_16325, partial [Pirellulales bacterium]